MVKSRYKRLYMSDLEKEIKYEHGEKFLDEFRGTYYYTKLRTVIFESRNLYYRDWNRPKKGSILYRLTFPVFIILILLVFFIGGSIKWVLFGDSEIFKPKSKIRLFFEKWNDKGGFDYI